MGELRREEVVELVQLAVESAINSRVVQALVWIVCVGILNFAAIVTGVWLFWDAQQNVKVVARDRWTGQMELAAEYYRDNLNAGYVPVPVREIQREYQPQ